MKVVLFCGGMGMRLREHSDSLPKPMIHIGYRPILWHVMKYYAHFGHKDFILCLGHRADIIKSYFRNYDETISNDFILTRGAEVQLVNSDIQDWRVAFVDSGTNATIGERLKAVEPYLKGEEVFLANYSDGLSDLNLNSYIDEILARGKIANFLCVRPTQSFHVVSVRDGGVVNAIEPVSGADVWINAGFFVFRKDIFGYIRPGEDLVLEPFGRLIDDGQLFAYKYTGFWTAMDTFKDKEHLEDLYARDSAPWQVWAARRSEG
jgi:glucose-1-phosphate cytidylyltransferase